MVTVAELRTLLDAVVDPEIPALSIAELGVLREVNLGVAGVEVVITPTYSGCAAMHMIRLDIETVLARAGIAPVQVRLVLSPAWTTDWLSAAAREKLRAAGIAPPPPAGTRRALFGAVEAACPLCGSARTEQISEFGSTACKALWRCLSCREPFDLFKCH